MIVLRVVSDKR